MALYGIIAFVIYGWVEFEAMAFVVDAIGGLFAFLGIFGTAIIGIHLLRSQSAIVMARFRADLSKGQMNSTAIASSLSLLLGAVLMLIPGYVTDALGLLCFIPGLRSVIGALIAKHVITRFGTGSFAKNPFGGANFGDTPFGQGTAASFTTSTDEAQNSARTALNSENDSTDDIIEGEFKEKN